MNLPSPPLGLLRLVAVIFLLGSIFPAAAQILVGTNGVAPMTFNAQPPAAQWSTLGVAGVAGDIGTIVGLDAQVQATSASTITAQTGATTGNPPAANAVALWTSAGYLQTKSTSVKCTLLMATLRNNSGQAVASIDISYSLATDTGGGAEELPGHCVYYSLTGAAGSWQNIGPLSGDGTAGSKAATLSLTSWTNNALLYILWADDNGSGSPDVGYQIDNFAVAPLALAPVISLQPQNQSVSPGATASFTVGVTGISPFAFQWRHNSNGLAGATNQLFTITNAQPEDAGFYSVVVSNAHGTATSTDAVLVVSCLAGPSINAPPASQTNFIGSTLNLSVTASGTQPLTFQWQRDGSDILNATNQTYSKMNAHFADAGSYRVVVSNCAGSITSLSAQVVVVEPPYVLVGLTNHLWKYEQSGADLGTSWREPGYDDSAWPSGRGVLGQETDNAVVLSLTNTFLSLTGTNGAGNITYYFRTHFTLSNDPLGVLLVSSNLIDDGAVVYLNGVEAFRFNMPATTIGAGTLASQALTEGVFLITNLPVGLALQGDNVLAVEVHQVTYASSDVVFGMGLFAHLIPLGPPAITAQPTSTATFIGQTVDLAVSANGVGGYQWFQNGVPLPSATNRTLTLTNASFPAGGFYQVVLTNAYGATTSSVATVSVINNEASLRLVEFTNAWRFNDSGMNLGTAWRIPAFNDDAWSDGRGVFWKTFSSAGFPETTNTVLPLLNGSGIVITTYYFRVHFTLPPGLTNLVLVTSNLVDDGAAFHLNGAEAGRIRLEGPVTATTFANLAGSDGRVREVIFLSATNLVAGDNVLAVEVHQASSNSSDVVFGMNLTAYGAYPQGVLLLTQLVPQTVLEGSPAEFFADAFGGQPLAYQWFRNSTLLAAETNATLTIAALHSATAGDYFFIASNSFGSVTSAVVALEMIPDVASPTLRGAIGTNGLLGVVVTFSEPVTAESATNVSNYALAPGVNILSAQLIAPNQILLITSGLDVQSDYTLTVSNIFDLADVPNVIAPGTFVRVQPNRIRVATGLLQVQTVFIILMENQRWSQVKGSTNAPYLNSLLPGASYCESYIAPGNLHPSQPNYIWLEAGDHFGHVNDNGPAVSRVASTNHLSTQLAAAGLEWRGYMEAMPYGSTGVTNALPYLARHNPFAFFDDVTTNYAYCTNHVRPYAEFAGDLAAGRIGRYNFLTPDVTNDMHSLAPGSTSLVRQGDDWLAREMPQILNSAAYSNNGAIFITWDENDFTEDSAIGMIVLSPLAKGGGYASAVPYDHSSTLRTMQEIFGVRPYLGAAAGASPMNDLFRDFALTLVPSNGLVQVRLENMLPGSTNYLQASSNLVHWTTISTNLADGAILIPDPAATGASSRFYRAIERP